MIGAIRALAFLGALLLACEIATVEAAGSYWDNSDEFAFHCPDLSESYKGISFKQEYERDPPGVERECNKCCTELNFMSGKILPNGDNFNKTDCMCQKYPQEEPAPVGKLLDLSPDIILFPKYHGPGEWCRDWDFDMGSAIYRYRGHPEIRREKCKQCIGCVGGVRVFFNGACGCLRPSKYLIDGEQFYASGKQNTGDNLPDARPPKQGPLGYMQDLMEDNYWARQPIKFPYI